ncbi:AzlD domain-containing protein [Jeotgalibacillus campisalis]|uniref:Branched-chain amino acid transporter n=1 Tax=Jeotgalibacillus campisalis TaxID=220754 RepID=A0A0C2VEK6_9BACL|nr:AzlD domain-containing protein [Jeotgalibacillus campisalis]KIL47352.1 branched-chain amino acid transporter [Jeotgalibacillus campisalis]
MNLNMLLLIAGMAAVTYIPRVLPLTILEGKELPPFVQSFLSNIPYAVLGALIFPGILLIKEGDIWFGLVGAFAAFALALAGANVMIVVIGSIIVLSGYLAIF